MTYPKGNETARYCSKSCAAFDRPPEINKRAGDKRRKPLVEKTCLQCGKTFYLKPMGQVSAAQKFCSKRCNALYRVRDTKVGRMYAERMWRGGNGWKGNKNPATAERMRLYNPTRNPEVVEKIKQKSLGKTFLSRGGNGTLSVQQKALCQALGLPDSAMEFVIPTARAKDRFQSLPPCYKVDIGIPELRLAVEVDGRTHKSKKWKFLDRRKTAVLNFLGWTVLRFWNREVDQDMNRCVQTVMSTISKLKETTTTSQMES
jgi:hypothetical protein